jgi:hypothetical protein
MTTIQCSLDWWGRGGRRRVCRRVSSLASVLAGVMSRGAGTASSDIRLVDENGMELGVIVAPHPGVTLTANGPTILLQRLEPAVVRRGQEHAA